MNKEKKIVEDSFEKSFIVGQKIGDTLKKAIVNTSKFMRILIMIILGGGILFMIGFFHSFKPKEK